MLIHNIVKCCDPKSIVCKLSPLLEFWEFDQGAGHPGEGTCSWQEPYQCMNFMIEFHKQRKQGLNPKLPGLKAHPLSIILLFHVTNLEMKKLEEKSLNSPLLHCTLEVMGVLSSQLILMCQFTSFDPHESQDSLIPEKTLFDFRIVWGTGFWVPCLLPERKHRDTPSHSPQTEQPLTSRQ